MVRYIVGIDYGHGETSAACVDLKATGTPVMDLTITGYDNKIHSMMVKAANATSQDTTSVDPNDWVLDPDWDTLKDGLVSETMSNSIPSFAAYFKGPISKGRDDKSKEIDVIAKKLFGIFCRKVYDEILQNNKFLTPAVYDKSGNVVVESNFVLYIACPSGWEDNEKLGLRQVSAYKEFLIENGIPCQDIVQESRAAYVSARDTIINGLSYNETPGVLIIDYGSSTIDLTWFGNKLAFTDGYELGARNVEEILFDYILNNDTNAQSVFNNYAKRLPNPLIAKMIAKYGMRLQKENFFNGLAKTNSTENSKKLAAVNLAEVIPDDDVDISDPDFRFTFSKPLRKDDVIHILETHKVTNASLNNQTYIGTVTEKLRSFAENPEVGKIDYVVLTGGATKMSFVQDLVKSTYNIDDDHLIVDNIAPSFAISRGVATYGVKKYYSDPLLIKIEQLFNDTWNNEEWVRPKLEELIQSSVEKVYLDKMLDILQSWVDGKIVADKKYTLERLIGEALNIHTTKEKTSRVWACVERADPIVDGSHSIHALLRCIFDVIDESVSSADITQKLGMIISTQIMTPLDHDEETNLGTMINNYIRVYFSETDLNSEVLHINLSLDINTSITDEQKIQFFIDLIEKSFHKIDEDSFFNSYTISTLNKDREEADGFMSPARKDLQNTFVSVFTDFAKELVASYHMGDCIDSCQKAIRNLFCEVKNKCELSTYTLK